MRLAQFDRANGSVGTKYTLVICICSLFAILFCPIYNMILRTSLSKVHNLIERFSEDIDLILDWRVLGYKKDEPW